MITEIEISLVISRFATISFINAYTKPFLKNGRGNVKTTILDSHVRLYCEINAVKNKTRDIKREQT